MPALSFEEFEQTVVPPTEERFPWWLERDDYVKKESGIEMSPEKLRRRRMVIYERNGPVALIRYSIWRAQNGYRMDWMDWALIEQNSENLGKLIHARYTRAGIQRWIGKYHAYKQLLPVARAMVFGDGEKQTLNFKEATMRVTGEKKARSRLKETKKRHSIAWERATAKAEAEYRATVATEVAGARMRVMQAAAKRVEKVNGVLEEALDKGNYGIKLKVAEMTHDLLGLGKAAEAAAQVRQMAQASLEVVQSALDTLGIVVTNPRLPAGQDLAKDVIDAEYTEEGEHDDAREDGARTQGRGEEEVPEGQGEAGSVRLRDDAQDGLVTEHAEEDVRLEEGEETEVA